MRYYGFGKTIGALKTLAFSFGDSAQETVSLPNLLINMTLPLSIKDGASVNINITDPAAVHPYQKAT